jgi:hypothetical protein
MRAYEFIFEGKLTPKIINDDIGGYIKILPNPDELSDMSKFSIVYINHDIAKFYKIAPRIIGIDSHGHIGVVEPHLHLFQKSKYNGQYDIKMQEIDFNTALRMFQDVLNAVKERYIKDKNGNF